MLSLIWWQQGAYGFITTLKAHLFLLSSSRSCCQKGDIEVESALPAVASQRAVKKRQHGGVQGISNICS